MKIHKALSSLALLSGVAFLAPTAFASGDKIGFVNVPEIMTQAPQAKAAREQLQKEFGARENALNAQRAEIQKQEADLQHNAAVMSASKKSAAEKSLQSKVSNFNRDMNSFRNDFTVKRNELLQGLQKRLYAVVLKVAKRGGYDLILSNGVVYASDKVNLTKQVLAELKKNKSKN